MTLTDHAAVRLKGRRISQEAVQAALDFGRMVVTRGAAIFVIGRREIARCRTEGIDLTRLDGVHVVCALDGAVITTYRNRNLHGLRRRGRRPRAA